jgi:hypothetical protein
MFKETKIGVHRCHEVDGKLKDLITRRYKLADPGTFPSVTIGEQKDPRILSWVHLPVANRQFLLLLTRTRGKKMSFLISPTSLYLITLSISSSWFDDSVFLCSFDPKTNKFHVNAPSGVFVNCPSFVSLKEYKQPVPNKKGLANWIGKTCYGGFVVWNETYQPD